MKFIVKTDDIRKAVNICAKALPSATTMEIMECILLEADDNNLLMTANNHDIAIQTSVPVVMQETGKVCVNGKLLQKIVATNPDQELMFETNEKYQTAVRSKTMRFDLPGKDGDDFTMPPKTQKENSLMLKRENFKAAIKKSAFCARENDSNVMLSGITIKVINEKITFVTTDGHRMAIRDIPLNTNCGKTFSLLVPVKTMVDIASIIDGEGDMEINYTNHQCLFTIDGTIITARLLAGNGIPDFHVPNDVLTVSVNRADLFNSINNALLLGGNSSIIMEILNNVFNLKYASDMGKWTGRIPCHSGGSIAIALNPKYVAAMLKCLDEENIMLHFTGVYAPVYVKGDNYTYIVMPISV